MNFRGHKATEDKIKKTSNCIIRCGFIHGDQINERVDGVNMYTSASILSSTLDGLADVAREMDGLMRCTRRWKIERIILGGIQTSDSVEVVVANHCDSVAIAYS